jgi:hypothetical protein
MANKKMVALLSLLFVGTGHALPEKRRVNLAPTPARIQGALGCLATVLAGMDDNDFKVFGLARHEFRPGKVVQARVHVHKEYWGSDPDYDRDYEYDVVLYAKDGLHGAFFTMYADETGPYVSKAMTYKLDRVGRRWEASEGNGGGPTYFRLGKEVTLLTNMIASDEIKLKPGKCSAEVDETSFL